MTVTIPEEAIVAILSVFYLLTGVYATRKTATQKTCTRHPALSGLLCGGSIALWPLLLTGLGIRSLVSITLCEIRDLCVVGTPAEVEVKRLSLPVVKECGTCKHWTTDKCDTYHPVAGECRINPMALMKNSNQWCSQWQKKEEVK